MVDKELKSVQVSGEMELKDWLVFFGSILQEININLKLLVKLQRITLSIKIQLKYCKVHLLRSFN